MSTRYDSEFEEEILSQCLRDSGYMRKAQRLLSRRHFTRATALATIYSPAEAIDVGYLDEVVEPDDLETVVMARAADLGARLSRSGFAATRRNDRHATIEMILASLDDDLARFGVDP